MPRDPSLVFGCKGALVTSKGIVLILLEGDLVTDRQDRHTVFPRIVYCETLIETKRISKTPFSTL